MSDTVAGVLGKDPTLPDVSIVLGGKTYALCFDFNAICTVEKLTGINLLEASIGVVSAVNVRALLYAAMLRDNPDMTLEQVGSLVTMRNVRNIHTALITAWFGSIETEADGATAPGEDQAQTQAV